MPYSSSMNRSARLVRKLYEVACCPEKGFGYQANELLRLGCELLSLEAGIIVKTEATRRRVKFAVSPLVSIKENDPLPSFVALGMKSHLEAPISIGSQPYGALIFAGRVARKGEFTQEEIDTVNLMAVWISKEIDRLQRERDLVDSARKLEALVKFDSLTGLYSRPSIEGRLKRLLKRSQFTAEPISAAVIDIDDLNDIAMKYGKSGADMAVTAVAQAIDEAVRPTDPSARIGNDEFLVLLVGANESQARMVAERIQKYIRQNYIEISGKKVDLSASIAVIELSDEIVHLEEIVKDTHARLMMAKKKSKGRAITIPG